MTTVSSGQVLSGATFTSSDSLIVQSGGSVVSTTLAGGFLTTLSGGSATNTTVGGAVADNVAGTDTGASVLSGSLLNVSSGGSAISSVIQSGATETVLNGGTAVAPILLNGGILTISAGAQVTGASLVPGASIQFAAIAFSSGVTASLNQSNDVLTVTSGGSVTTLHLQGNYTGDSFIVSSFNAPFGLRGSLLAAAVTEVSGNLLASAPGGVAVPLTTSTPVQTALAQQILTLAAKTSGSQTLYAPGQSSIPLATTLASPVLVDLPERQDTITGAAAVQSANLLLANPGATYVTGGTAASVVVVADAAPATVVNNSAGDSLIAVTGAANNMLGGLAGANEFITGSGGQNAVLLDGGANALSTYGTDAVLVGGSSTITVQPGAIDNAVMTTSTTLAFVNLSANLTPSSITGAAGATVVMTGPGNTVVTAGAGSESFFVDSSAGNTTLKGSSAGGDGFTFVHDASNSTATIVVSSFVASDTLSVHGYAAFNVQANATGGASLSLSDGSQVTFANTAVATIQQAVRVV